MIWRVGALWALIMAHEIKLRKYNLMQDMIGSKSHINLEVSDKSKRDTPRSWIVE